ncbi:amino acid adenylation domain-containing protein [Photobacterium sp. CAU 1568]|uniref:Amino acid adenylation domain-containing protein n=1 Tax=Photobacterium arenosum TaxID=2774143 RepID=A0ABR9BPR7_9GAMM|nr:non-ribosomal peptide synthetase [Photobacterium arenosum]MBD8514253.1 amino acid adenylation domain-containing protein [Photobacterium arenosum]
MYNNLSNEYVLSDNNTDSYVLPTDITPFFSEGKDDEIYSGKSELSIELSGDKLSDILSICGGDIKKVNTFLKVIWHKILHVYSQDNCTVTLNYEKNDDSKDNFTWCSYDWGENESLLTVSLTENVTHSRVMSQNDIFGDEYCKNKVKPFFVIRNIFGKSEKPDFTVCQPIMVDIKIDNNNIEITMCFDKRYISLITATKLIELYESILNQIIQSPEKKHAELVCLSEKDCSQQLLDWGTVSQDFPLNVTAHKIFEMKVEENPEKIALVFQETSVTYRELNERANILAHRIQNNYLARFGKSVSEDTLIGLYFDRSIEMVISILAVLKAGGAYLPLSTDHPKAYLEQIISDVNLDLIIAHEFFSEDLNSILNNFDNHVEVINPILYGCENSDFINNPVSSSHCNSLAYVIFTSGTTGKPKGVMVEHKNLVNLICGQINTYNLTDNETVMWWPPYHFDGSVDVLFMTLLHGARLIIPSTESIHSIEQMRTLVKRYQVTHFAATPTYLSALGRGDFDASLKWVISAGEQCSQAIKDSWKERLVNVYGPTETTAVSVRSTDIGSSAEVNRIGRPVANAKLYVLNDNLQLLPQGAIGELYIGGAGVSRGYWNQPTLTADRFLNDPFATDEEIAKGYNRMYRTGDMVRWLFDGNLEYVSRKDLQVKIRGYRIELSEIESALLTYEGVKQAAVITQGQGEMKYLSAYLIGDDNTKLNISEIRNSLSEILPEYMLPSAFLQLDSLPVTLNGKLDWRALPVPVSNENHDITPPRNEKEKILCESLQHFLGYNKVGIHANFFEMGGNSIIAIRAAADWQEKLGIKVDVATIISQQSVAVIAENLGSELSASIVAQNLSSCPLSSSQKGLYFFEQLENGAKAYHVPQLIKLNKSVDLLLLQDCISILVERHAILRTCFGTVDNEEVQYLTDQWPSLNYTNTLTQKSFWEQVKKDIDAPFKLASEPGFRLCGYDVEGQRYLLFTWHHIACDGWSTEVFFNELSHIYKSLMDGECYQLPSLPISYFDYVVWQENQLTTDESKIHSDYWTDALSGAQDLIMPLTYPRPAVFDYKGGEEVFRLSELLSSQLKALARKYKVSLNTVMLSGFYILLSRLSGQYDITIGIPSDNREHRQTHGVMGLFVNPLPIRLQASAQVAISELIHSVHQSLTLGKAHQDLPFDKILNVAHTEREASKHPLFQVMFNGHDFLNGISNSEPLFQHIPMSEQAVQHYAQFDLNVTVGWAEKEIQGTFNFASSLFSRADIKRYVEMYRRVLQKIVAPESEYLSDVDMLEVGERQHLLGITKAQYTKVFVDSQLTVQQRFQEQVRRAPLAEAIEFDGHILTYQELYLKACQVANLLHSKCPSPHVGIYMTRSLEMVIAIWGTLFAGKAYVPMEPDQPHSRTELLANQAQVGLLLCNSDTYHQAMTISVESLLIDVNANPLSDSTHLSDRQYQSDSLAYIIFTSGSTGQPKGVMVAHQALTNRIDWMQRQYSLLASDTVLQKTPFSFDVSVWEFIWPLVAGAKLVIAKPGGHRDAHYLAELIQVKKITTLHFVPSMLRAMLDSGCWQGCDSVQRVFCSGEALSPELCDRFFHSGTRSELHNLYGPTEAAIDVSFWQCEPSKTYKTVPIGRPIQNIRLLVLDPDLNLVPTGCQGELYISGIGLAEGYCGQPELTAASFIASPFDELQGERLYKTGDLARWVAHSELETNGTVRPAYLEYLGRKDHQVKLRGHRIELGEIEHQINRLDGVQACAVVLKQVGDNDQLVVYHIGNAENTFIQTRLAEILPDYMVPKIYQAVDHFPLSANGKLNRKALLDVEINIETSAVSPETPEQAILCDIWKTVLGVESVSITDNFFALGGDSILSIQVVSLAKRRHLEFSVQDLFIAQTIEKLSEKIISKQTKVIESEVDGEQVLLPAQAHFFSSAHTDLTHYNQSMLLELSVHLTSEQLACIVSYLVSRHDVLRLHFHKKNEQWTGTYQTYTKVQLEQTWSVVSVQPDQISSYCENLQGSLSFSGPLFHFSLLEHEGKQLLFVTFHHLLVDGVSWRVLLADIDDLINQLPNSDLPFSLPNKTDSLQSWGKQLQTFATEQFFAKESEYWQRQSLEKLPKLPTDGDEPFEDTWRSINTFAFTLTDEQSRSLRERGAALYGLKENELLLIAAYLGINRWRGVKAFRVLMEAHGRETAETSLSLTETLGWFTSLYPVVLRTSSSQCVESVMKTLKEQLRAVPGNGLGYGVLRYINNAASALTDMPADQHYSSLMFNYLGQVDGITDQLNNIRAVSGTVLMSSHSEQGHPTRGDIALSNRRESQLMLNVLRRGQQYVLELGYSRSEYRDASIKQLADDILASVARIIEHCNTSSNRVLTQSDFSLAHIMQDEVEQLSARYPDLADIYDATPMQKGLFYHHLKGDAGGEYVSQIWMTLNGKWDESVYRSVWSDLVKRHEGFRTAFSDDGRYQLVLTHADIHCYIEDVKDLEPSRQQERLKAYLEKDKLQSFDFACPPLVRLAVFNLSDETQVLQVTYHHSILDGWSVSLMLTELLTLYKAKLEERCILLPEPAYPSYLQWLERQDSQKAMAYWKDVIGDISSATPLAIDKIPVVSTTQGARERRWQLDERDTEQLKVFARTHNTTLSVVVQAAWAYLLHRYSGEQRVMFGSANAGRPAEVEGIENTIGLMVNTLPVVVDCDNDLRISEWLKQIHDLGVERDRHGFLSLAEIQSCCELPEGEPLFETLVGIQNYPVDKALFGSRKEEQSQLSSQIWIDGIQSNEQTNYTVTLMVEPYDNLEFVIGYRAEQLNDNTVAAMVEHLQHILRVFMEQQPATIADLTMQSEQELEQLLAISRGHSQPYPEQLRINTLFEEYVELSPQHNAVKFGDLCLTYSELNRKANQLAHYLCQRGVAQGDWVGICITPQIDTIIAILAVIKAGAVYVPLDPAYPSGRIQFMLEDAGIKLLITDSECVSLLTAAASKGSTIILLDGDDRHGIDQCNTSNLPAPEKQSAAYVNYTSGSTGTPKGTVVEHHNVIRLVKNTNYIDLKPQTMMAFASNTSFDAVTFEIWGALLNGGTLIHIPKDCLVDPLALADKLRQESVTTLFVTTALFNLVSKEKPDCFACLETLLFGGEAVSTDAVQAILHHGKPQQLLHVYGPTEGTTFSTWYPVTEQTLRSYTTVPIGYALSNTSLYVLDEKQRLVPVGVPGELYIGGEGIVQGYHNRPGMNEKAFIHTQHDPSDRLYRTGDLVRRLEDGSLVFVGRADEQLKIRGYRIELGEVQSCLTELKGVSDAVVLAQTKDGPDAQEKELVAYMVLNEMLETNPLPKAEKTEQLLDSWQALYDNLYRHSDAENMFDTTGWNSSYTGQPLSADEMKEWQRHTVSRILSLSPQRIYEIGVGTGLLLLQLHSHCQHYSGIDLSGQAVERLRHLMSKNGISHVDLRQAEACNDSQRPIMAVDTVIINSVCQYFPSIHYFYDVIQSAIKAMDSTGCIFIGDVLNYRLMDVFHVELAHHRLGSDATLEELYSKASSSMAADNELYVSPEFFTALIDHCPEVVDIKVQLKTGFANNEMNQFRYDVCIYIDKAYSGDNSESVIAEHDWQQEPLPLNALQSMIQSPNDSDCLVIRGIRNSRLMAMPYLADIERELVSTGDINLAEQSAAENAVSAIHPGELAQMCEAIVSNASHWADYQITWSVTHGMKSVDLWLYKHPEKGYFHDRNLHNRHVTFSVLASNPGQSNNSSEQAKHIQQQLAVLLPSYMQPVRFNVVDKLPLTPNGKVNKQALLSHDLHRVPSGLYVAPQTNTEQKLAEIWQDLLQLNRVGCQDNFFELGGHSLLATRLISAIRKLWQVDIAIKAIFEAPTVGELAALIQQSGTSELPAITAMPREGLLELSFSQQRLCFIDQLGNAREQYNVPLAFRIEGNLNIQAMKYSLERIVERHEVLRTNIEIVDGKPYQRIRPAGCFELDVIDLSELAAQQQQISLEAIQKENNVRRFVLASELKLRAKIIKLSDTSHLMLITLHHIAADGWSIGIVIDEINAWYRNYTTPQASALPPLPVQYADFSQWQRKWLQGEVLDEQLSYWRHQLRGLPDVHQLPTDFSRQKTQSYHGGSINQTLGRQQLQGLKQLAADQGVSLFMVLHAAYVLLMHRYSGEQDIVIGTPVAGREQHELSPLIGFFVNNLVLRSRLDSVSDFTTLIQQSKQVLLEAYEHQQTPFEMLVEQLKPNRSLSHNPLFQVVLSLQNMQKSELMLQDCQVTPVETSLSRVSYDLVLHVSEEEDNLHLRWEFSTDLFKASRIRKMAGHFDEIVNEVTKQAVVPVSSVATSRWQQDHLHQQNIQKSMQFWKSQLTDAAHGRLYQDKLITPTTMTQAVKVSIDSDMTTELQMHAEQLNLSSAVILQACLGIALSCVTQQSNVLFGVYRGDNSSHGEKLAYLPAKLSVKAHSPFNELLDEYSQWLHLAQQHQGLSFSALKEGLNEGDELYQVGMSALQNVTIESLPEEGRPDIILQLEPEGQAIQGQLVFSGSQLAVTSAQRLATLFERVVKAVSENVNVMPSDIPLMNGQERDLCLNVWNATDTVWPDSLTLAEVFERHVRTNPDALAVTWDGGSLTYAQLNNRANQLASVLMAQHLAQTKTGLAPDTCIALVVERSPEMIISMLGVLKAGAAYVPIDPTIPADRLRFILDDTQAPLMITQSALLNAVTECLNGTDCSLVNVDDVIAEDILTGNPESMASSRNLAYVIYTSGTTGQPKGVMVEQFSVVNHAYGLAAKLGDAFSRVDFSTNYSFDLSVATNLCPLLTGATVAIYQGDQRNIHDYHQHLLQQKVTLVKSTPSLAEAAFTSIPMPECTLLLGGEALHPSLLNVLIVNFRQVFNEYGPTEATVAATITTISDKEAVTIGQAFPNVRLYCLNEELEPAPIGVPGELYIGGAGVARGYLNRPALTAQRFIDNPFVSLSDIQKGYTRLYRTGDFVRWTDTGHLDFIGRNDEQVKVRGFRVELGEIESALRSLPAINQATVVVRDTGKSSQLVAYVVVNSGEEASEAYLLGLLTSILPGHMLPSAIIRLEHMPLTANGKIDKRALPASDAEFSENFIAPTQHLEQVLCHIWQEVLGVEKVGVHDNFFRIGGESILCIQLVARLRREGFQLQVKDVFESPTVAGLAALLNQDAEEAEILSEQGVLAGEFDLLPVQAWFFDRQLANPHHFNQSFTVNLPAGVTQKSLEEALYALTEHHDMLRSRFVQQNDGSYRQFYSSDVSASVPTLQHWSLSGLSTEEQEERATAFQSGLNIEIGPLWQAAIVSDYDDGTTRLLFTFHHLVIDAVSCRTVGEHMKLLLTGQSLPSKGSSYRQWVEAVKQYARDNENEISYWQDVLADQAAYQLPEARKHRKLSLTQQETSQLLHIANKGFNTEINDLLLSALALSLSHAFKREANLITLEGHGRESIHDQIDVTQAVGWFTTHFPVRLTAYDTIAETIIRTKESLRTIPKKGLGFSSLNYQGSVANASLPAVGFNYLGQLDTGTTAEPSQDWQMKAEGLGMIIDKANQEALQLTIYGGVQQGVLTFECISLMSNETTDSVIQYFEQYLQQVISEASAKAYEGGQLTPSDVSADISLAHLRHLQGKFNVDEDTTIEPDAAPSKTIRI